MFSRGRRPGSLEIIRGDVTCSRGAFEMIAAGDVYMVVGSSASSGRVDDDAGSRSVSRRCRRPDPLATVFPAKRVWSTLVPHDIDEISVGFAAKRAVIMI